MENQDPTPKPTYPSFGYIFHIVWCAVWALLIMSPVIAVLVVVGGFLMSAAIAVHF